MNVQLDKIERSFNRSIRHAARDAARTTPRSFQALIAIAFSAAIVAPFAVCVGLFVPLFGQLLVLSLILLSLVFVWVARSWKLFLALAGGFSVGLTILGLIATAYHTEAAPFYYLLAAFSVFITIVANIALVGGIWGHFDRGRQAFEEASRASSLSHP